MQTINTNNTIGLQAELTPFLYQAVAIMKDEWLRNYTANYECIRINPLQAELYPTTSLGLTVVQSADVPVGFVQLVANTPF